MSVSTILKDKGGDVVSLGPNATVAEAAKLLSENRIGSVLVMEGGEKVLGLVSERDIVHAFATKGAIVLEAKVATIMTRNLVVCEAGSPLDSVMVNMTERRCRHLPVMEGEKLVGIISIGDVVKSKIAELEYEAHAMREYIASG